MTWDEIFQPALDHLCLKQRPTQRALGWAICEAIDSHKSLVGEARTGTGKSVAYLVPAIHAVKAARTLQKKVRVVVSTETIALQDQLVNKDLPQLHEIYGGFSYRVLKGRTWYFCKNRAKSGSLGNKKMSALFQTLDRMAPGQLGDGERHDLEKALKRELEDKEWQQITGHATYCADAMCKPDRCFAARARELALKADIVVANHAIIRTDADMKLLSDGERTLLGNVDILVIDEAHTLERVLVDGWTDELSPWNRSDYQAAVIDALVTADTVLGGRAAGDIVDATHAFDEFEKACDAVTDFYQRHDGGDKDKWKTKNFPLSQVYLSGSQEAATVGAMVAYESFVPDSFLRLQTSLETILPRLKRAVETAEDTGQKGRRKLRKGKRAAEELIEVCGSLLEAMQTKNGIVTRHGVPYGVTVNGVYIFRERRYTVTFKIVPLDVSKRCERLIWEDKTCLLVSATLTDPIDGTFKYTVASLGVKNYLTVETGSAFEYATQQLVYITPGTHEKMPLIGAQSSIDELVELIRMSNGRTLVLFTARAELEHAAEEIVRLKHAGEFPWPVYVQEIGVSKQKLADAFRSQEHSVLLGTKSFFTGVDFPGSTCTTVALAKFPLGQYNALCRQQIEWWRGRGFPQWYERDALMTLSQAAGRLIRSETDHGVVAILDQRCADPRDKIRRMTDIGIKALGSPVTQSLEDVGVFLGSHA